jgi:hypothetical protein
LRLRDFRSRTKYVKGDYVFANSTKGDHNTKFFSATNIVLWSPFVEFANT